MRYSNFLAFLAFVPTVGLTFASMAFGQVPPSKEFVSMSAGNFEVIVDANHQAEGEFYFRKLLQADAFLHSYFTTFPSRVVVVINDRTDLTNGYATKIPYSHIVIFPVLPGPTESLGEPGNWSLELLTHEYTHLLNFEPANGVFHYLRPVFGTIASPNILLPNWWKEGLAVQMESSVANGGRTQSAYQDAMIRSWTLDHKLASFDIASANEALPTWPQGQRAYIFGSIFWSEVVADSGAHVIKELNERHGGRFPYFIETPAKDNFGRTYEAEYTMAIRETERKANEQIEKLNSVHPTNDEKVNIKNAVLEELPSFSHDGKYLALITKSDIDVRKLRIFKRNPATNTFQDPVEVPLNISQEEEAETKKVFDEPPAGTMSRNDWFHNKPIVVFDRVDSVNPFESYSDLYMLNVDDLHLKRLSHGLRAREAAVSPDDNSLVYVQLGMGQTSLATFDLNTNTSKVLLQKPIGQRIAFPVYLNSNQILYSLYTEDGKENFEIFNLSDGSVKPVSGMPAGRNRIPSMTNAGVIFVSTANGVDNIYEAKNNFASVKPITHSLTGYLTGDLDPVNNDLYATKMTSDGPELVRIPQAEWSATPKNLPKVKPLFADHYPQHDVSAPTEVQKAEIKVEPYSPYGYLWPHYWIPFFNFTSNGWAADIITSGFDPLQRHSYSAMVGWESEVKRLSWDLEYTNYTHEWPFFLETLRTNTYFIDANSFLSATSYLLGSQQQVFSISKYFSLGGGIVDQDFEVPAQKSSRRGIFAQAMYGHLYQSGMQISPESDKSFFLKVAHYPMNDKFPVHSQVWGSANLYLSSFLPERNSIMLKVSGLYTPERIGAAYGTSSIAYTPLADPIVPQFLMRGYLTGHFIGKSALSPELEYRFPFREINRGAGTDPIFIRRLYGAIIHDGMMVDGFVYRKNKNAYDREEFNGYFGNVGAEARLDTVIGYVLPVKFIVGYYEPLDENTGGTGETAISLQLSQFF